MMKTALTTIETRPRTFRALTLLLALITAFLGLLALLGWSLGLPSLASFAAGMRPMAPSTALLLLLNGAAIVLRVRTPLSRSAFWISVTAGGLAALVAVLLCALSTLNIHPGIEHLGLNILGTVGGVNIGHMSPVTALCFLLTSVSFLASLSLSVIRPWRTVLALGSAGVLLGTVYVFLLAYVFGTSLLYGGTFIPPALNTLLAFITLGLALLVLGSRAGALRGHSSDSSALTALHFFLIFVVLAGGVITAGYSYYRNRAQSYRAAVESHLSSIADLKVGELTQWRGDRFGDAALFFRNPSFSALVRRFFAQPADADARRQLLDWLDKYSTLEDYDQVRLMDTQSVTRLSMPDNLNPASVVTVRAASESLRLGRITIQDFYRLEHSQRVYLSVQIPIFDDSDASRPLGVIIMRIDPAKYLYPFIQRWPTPSATAETLLVRREGNEVLFLNELRFQTNTALRLRERLDHACAEAQAALGREGVTDGMDYRGESVVAVMRTVPNSPWALVARMDSTEVQAPMHAQLWQVIAVIGALLFSAGAGVGLVWGWCGGSSACGSTGKRRSRWRRCG